MRTAIYFTALLALCAFVSEAHAVTWNNAPLACLPERAAPWKDGTQPELCHCPPQSMCPSATANPITWADISFGVTIIPLPAALKALGTNADGANDNDGNSYTALPTTTPGAIYFTIKGTDVNACMQNIQQCLSNVGVSAATINDVMGGGAFANNYQPSYQPNQVLAIADQPVFGCSFGPYGSTNGAAPAYGGRSTWVSYASWGNLQDYIRPVVQQYLHNMGNIPANDVNAAYGTYDNIGYSGLCNAGSGPGSGGSIYQYSVTVLISDAAAGAMNANTKTMPPQLVEACCPNTFQCPGVTNSGTLGQGTLLYSWMAGGQRSNTPTESTTLNNNVLSCQLTVNSLHMSCLLEGTPVVTSDGKAKKIEEIKIGDTLKNYKGGKDVTVQAINRYTQGVDELYGFNGGKAFITAEHPVLTTDGWKSVNPDMTKVKSIAPVGKLKVGDKILTGDGNMLEILSIDKHIIGGKPKVYNLSVKDGDGVIAGGIVAKSFSQVQIHY